MRRQLPTALLGAALVVASSGPIAQPTPDEWASLWVQHPGAIDWTRETGVIPLDQCIEMGVRVLRYYDHTSVWQPAYAECRHGSAPDRAPQRPPVDRSR